MVRWILRRDPIHMLTPQVIPVVAPHTESEESEETNDVSTPITRDMLREMLWKGTAWKESAESLERFLDLAEEYGRQRVAGTGNVPQASVPTLEIGADGICPTCGNAVELSLNELKERLYNALHSQDGVFTAETLLREFSVGLPECEQCRQLREQLAAESEQTASLLERIRRMEGEFDTQRMEILDRAQRSADRATALEYEIRGLKGEKESKADAYLTTAAALQEKLTEALEERAAALAELERRTQEKDAEIALLREELDNAHADLADAMMVSVFGAQPAAEAEAPEEAVAQEISTDPQAPLLTGDDPLFIQRVIDAVTGLPSDIKVMPPFGRLADGAQLRLFRFDPQTGRVRLITPEDPQSVQAPLSAADVVKHAMAERPISHFHLPGAPLVPSEDITQMIVERVREDLPPLAPAMAEDPVPADPGAPSAVDVKGDKGGHGVRHSTAYEGDENEPKQCKRCAQWKTRGDFHKDRSLKDGRCSKCRVCNSAVEERKDREAAHLAVKTATAQ
jgi:hypothetical protein